MIRYMRRNLLLVVLTALLMPSLAKAQWNVQPGYRSFYDLGVNLSTGGISKNNFEISTSQGYQLVPTYFYIGTGVAFQAFFNADGACGFPVFINLRTNLSSASVSPFFDVRVGYASISNSDYYRNGGFYLNPSVGMRIALSKTVGLNLRVGYTLQYAKTSVYYSDYNDDIYHRWQNKNIGGINIQAGIDF